MKQSNDFNSNPQERDLLRVCRIGRAQGLKGEVNVQSFTDSEEKRFAPGSVLVTKDGREFTVARSRKFKQRRIVLFEGIDNRNASEELKGIVLYCEPDNSADISNTEEPEDGWYIRDLIDLDVILSGEDINTENAENIDIDSLPVIGKVTNVINSPAQDLFEIRLNGEADTQAGKIALIPFVESIVPFVDADPESGYILILPPPGLLEI